MRKLTGFLNVWENNFPEFFDKAEQKGIEDKVETMGRWDGDGVSREAVVTE